MQKVQHTVCVIPPLERISEHEDADFPVTASLGADGSACVRLSSHSGTRFDFDQCVPVRSAGPLDVLSACPVTPPHTAFVIHGAEDAGVYGVFCRLIATILNTLRTRESATQLAPHVDYSVLRIYSWGATDVLRRESVEDNMTTPRRTPLLTGSTDITPARRCRATLVNDADLHPLWDALERAQLVPDGHSALCCSLYSPVSLGGFGTVKLLLLPRLQRVNHRLWRDLLQLRTWLAETRRSPHRPDPPVACRLKDFLTDAEDGVVSEGQFGTLNSNLAIRVLSVVRTDTTKLDETTLNTWFGSLSDAETLETWERFASTFGSPSSAATPMGGQARADTHVPSLASFGDGRGVGSERAHLPTTPPRNPAASYVLPPTPRSFLSQHMADAVMSASASTGSQSPTSGAQAAAAVVEASEKTALDNQLLTTRREVEELELVKKNLERVIADLMGQLSVVVSELDDSAEDMLSEVARAERALRTYHATTATEQQTEMRRIERRLSSLHRAPSL